MRVGELPRWKISPFLTGWHQVYIFTPDSVYADGRLAEWARANKTGMSRYPGGTVVKYWDWESPTGVMKGDPWDPEWNSAHNPPASEWMGLEEFLTFARTAGIAPMFGVNCLSGERFGRRDDGIARAVRMVRYAKERGFGGGYWYVGNEEVHLHGGVEGYATVFALYAAAMKAADPAIRVFWNDNEATPARIKRFLAADRGTADGLETHGKWPYGGQPKGYGPGTFDEWREEVPLRDRKNGNRAWREAANVYRVAAIEAGRPGLLIANNEYGLGSAENLRGFDRFSLGLLLTENLMEHFVGNWFSACFWDLTLDSERGLLDRDNRYRYNPLMLGMELLGPAQGGDYFDVVTDVKTVHGFASRTASELRVFLLNKTDAARSATFAFGGIVPVGFAAPASRIMQNSANGYGEIVPGRIELRDGVYSAELPALSFTCIIFPVATASM